MSNCTTPYTWEYTGLSWCKISLGPAKLHSLLYWKVCYSSVGAYKYLELTVAFYISVFWLLSTSNFTFWVRENVITQHRIEFIALTMQISNTHGRKRKSYPARLQELGPISSIKKMPDGARCPMAQIFNYECKRHLNPKQQQQHFLL